MIVIGSTAIKHHFPDFKREPKDIDYLVNIKSMWKSVAGKEEYHENPVLWNYVGTEKYLDKDLLYTLKASHLFWDIKWDKHIYDIQFMKEKGCVLNIELFYKLYDYWNGYHSKNKRSDLKMTSSAFFNNAIKCPYEHDFLHTLLVDTPTFTKILKDGEDVEVSEEKLSLVREEVYVMAYERLAGRHFRAAYSWMLKKFLISHAPLWESIFIIENYTLLSRPHLNYVNLINSKIYELKTNQ